MKPFTFILISIFTWIFTGLIFGVGYYLSGHEFKPCYSLGATYAYGILSACCFNFIAILVYFAIDWKVAKKSGKNGYKLNKN